MLHIYISEHIILTVMITVAAVKVHQEAHKIEKSWKETFLIFKKWAQKENFQKENYI